MKRMRRTVGLAAAVGLVIATAFCHGRVHRAREGAGTSARAALETVLTPGEVLGATLLGGFRSIAINMAWVRLLERLEEQRYGDLPMVYRAVEVLQGGSPALYVALTDQMVLDIPRHLPHRPAERWAWVRRGFELLERARRRFPGDPLLLRQAEILYYVRFHPERSAEDRRRFLSGSPEGGVEYGRDPLDLAREAGEAATLDPRHSFDVDHGLWAIYRYSLAYGTAAGGGPGAESAKTEMLQRAERLLDHAGEAHRGPDAQTLISDWRRQLEEERRLGAR